MNLPFYDGGCIVDPSTFEYQADSRAKFEQLDSCHLIERSVEPCRKGPGGCRLKSASDINAEILLVGGSTRDAENGQQRR